MIMNIRRFVIACLLTLPLLFSCSDEEQSVAGDGVKPEMDLAVFPLTGLKYGDKITVAGTLTDVRNMKMYSIALKDGNGTVLSRKDQMLLGTSFQMQESLFIPMPPHAQGGDLQVEVSLENTHGGTEVQTFTLPSLRVPEFEKLYLILGNNSVVEMLPNGDVFEAEDFFPARVKGYISTTSSTNGLYWGQTKGEIQSMGRDSILIGGDLEASCKLTFNPKSFELTFGERHAWTPLPAADCYYIFGTISGHWMDGDITAEKAKMRMQGFESDNLRYYSWFPPEGDDAATGMWGATAAGIFRMKKGGTDSFVLWNGTELANGTLNDVEKSFPLTAGGAFEIRVYFEDETCTKVQVLGSDRTLEFANNRVKINGAVMGSNVDFAGSALTLQAGTNYIYESKVALEKGKSITSAALELAGFKPSADLISGSGNSSWALTSFTGDYIVRLDVFSGACYICPVKGYPDVVYMNGWSWAATDTDNPVTWEQNRILPLIRTSGTTYEGTCYNFGWGGSAQFYLNHPSQGANIVLPNTDFTGGYIDKTPGSFLLPTAVGYYKVVLDLKEGVTISADGAVTPKGSQKFTLNYVAQ